MHQLATHSCTHTYRNRFLSTVISFVLVALLASCTSAKNTSVSNIEPGDKITVHLNDGSKILLKVVELNANQIVGKHRSVARSDVAQVAVRRADPGKSALLAGGILATLLIFTRQIKNDVKDIFDPLVDPKN